MLPEAVIGLFEEAQTSRASARLRVRDDVSVAAAYFQNAAALFERAGAQCESLARQAWEQARGLHQKSVSEASIAYGAAAEHFQHSCTAYRGAYDALSDAQAIFRQGQAVPLGILVKKLMTGQRHYSVGQAMVACGAEHVALLTGVIRATARELP